MRGRDRLCASAMGMKMELGDGKQMERTKKRIIIASLRDNSLYAMLCHAIDSSPTPIGYAASWPGAGLACQDRTLIGLSKVPATDDIDNPWLFRPIVQSIKNDPTG